MKKEEIETRLSDVVENELTKIYVEMEIKTGNIEPLQALKWDEIVNNMTDLFIELINQNRQIKKYMLTENRKILNEKELESYFEGNITEYDDITDWIFDSIRCGLIEEIE